MSEIVVFDPEERITVEKALGFAARKKSAHHGHLCQAQKALDRVADGISRYPSILTTQRLRNRSRSVDTLVELLCSQSPTDRALQTPTRAVLGKGFLIAKIHFFSLIKDMYAAHPLMNRRARTVMDHISANVFTLMSEDVFVSILEDRHSATDLRRRAAQQLAGIWEWRLSRSIEQVAPVLFSMWKSRRSLRPIYGTMIGSSELLHLSVRAHPLWLDFLTEHGHTPETLQALEEFLFDLTHEELLLVRSEMARRSLKAVNRRHVWAILNKQDRASEGGGSEHGELDPRWMYSFFQERRTNAHFRARAELPGPRKTVEELLISFLLSHAPPPPAPPGSEDLPGGP